MKLLIISSGFYPVTNNMGGAIENLIETYLIENDKTFKDEITLYSVKTAKSMQEKNFENTNIRVINKTTIIYKVKQILNLISSKFGRNYKGNTYIKEVIRDLKKKNEINAYDCIIVENIGKFIPIIKRVTDSKVVLHLHNDYLNVDTENGENIVEACDNIWCVSEFICERVRKIIKNGSEKNKVKLLYNGIDLSEMKKQLSKEEKENIKRQYNINNDEKVIIYTGRLMPEKGVKELIQAYIELSKEKNDIVLLIAGGARQINKNKNNFINKIHKLSKKTKNRVIFTGCIPYKQLYKIYSIADIQVVPSIWEEAFGLTVVEGMNYEIPIIVTNSGGIPEIVHKDYELMVNRDLNIIQNLKDKMKYVLDNPEVAENITKEYPNKISKFTNEEYSNNFNILMKQIKETE
mgnify:FL=1